MFCVLAPSSSHGHFHDVRDINWIVFVVYHHPCKPDIAELYFSFLIWFDLIKQI